MNIPIFMEIFVHESRVIFKSRKKNLKGDKAKVIVNIRYFVQKKVRYDPINLSDVLVMNCAWTNKWTSFCRAHYCGFLNRQLISCVWLRAFWRHNPTFPSFALFVSISPRLVCVQNLARKERFYTNTLSVYVCFPITSEDEQICQEIVMFFVHKGCKGPISRFIFGKTEYANNDINVNYAEKYNIMIVN